MMKSKQFLRYCILTGFVIFFTQGCKKEDEKHPEDFNYGTVSDLEGNVYRTIQVEIPVEDSKGTETGSTITQTWMVDNLKTTKYDNGDLIETTTPATLNIYEEAVPKYQWAYDGDESYVSTYGRD